MVRQVGTACFTTQGNVTAMHGFRGQISRLARAEAAAMLPLQ